MIQFSLPLAVLNIFIMLLLLKGWHKVYSGYGKIYAQKNKSIAYIYIYFILLFILSVYGGLDWDYYNYEKVFLAFKERHVQAHLEPIYFIIADDIESYTAWRIFVWGCATLIMVFALKRFDALNLCTCVFITLFYVLSFYKLRSSLGTSIYLYGISCIIVNKSKNFIRLILGIGIIGFSILFHKSMALPISLFFLTYFLPLNKTTLYISLLLFPIALIGVTNFISDFLSETIKSDITEVQLAVGGAHNYLSKEASYVSTIGKITNVISYLPIYLGLYLSFKRIFRNDNGAKPPRYIVRLCWLNYFIVFIASLFIFIDASNWLYIRFLTMSYLTMAIVLSYIFSASSRTNGIMKIILIFGIIHYLESILYTFNKDFNGILW